MKIESDARFRHERRAYDLKFTCEDCALFVEHSAQCAHGFPTYKHRTARYRDRTALILFCKEFELQ